MRCGDLVRLSRSLLGSHRADRACLPHPTRSGASLEVSHDDVMLVVAVHGDPIGPDVTKVFSLTLMGPGGQLCLAWEEFLEVVT